jgi:hypothetical protein
MSASNNAHPELQKAERLVASAEAAVGKAQSVVGDLQAKHAAAVKYGAELADERAGVALSAHTGDQQAAKRLMEIHQQIAIHASELASLDAAVRVAGDRVAAAQSARAVELQKLDAIKLRAVSAAFRAQCQKIDKVLDALVNALFDAEPIRQQLNALDAGPSFQQWTILGERPILLALADTDFEGRIGRVLAPNERMTFAALAESWSHQHEVIIARILGDQQTSSTEAA